MKIQIISCLNDNYSYLIHDELSEITAIVDPSEFTPCDEAINKNYKKLDFIINTHHHYDHVEVTKSLKKNTKQKYLALKMTKIVSRESIKY